MSQPAVMIGGHPLSEIGPYTVDSLTDRQEGPYAAQITIAWPPAKRPRWLTLQAATEVTVAGRPRWTGNVADIDWNGGVIQCDGVSRERESVPAIDPTTGQTTSSLQAAALQAVTAGWVSWANPTAMPSANIVSTGTTDGLNTILALTTAWETENQRTITIDARRRIVIPPAQTVLVPKWYVLPQAGVLGVTEDALARTLVGRYADSASSGALKNVTAGSGRPVQGVDLSNFGSITAARATTILNGMLAKLGVLYGWTEGITISRSQIITPGGVHPHLSRPLANDVVRILGQRNTHGQAVSYDVVLGESIWKPGGYDGGTLDLNPVNLAPRDLASVIEAAGGEAS